MQPTVAKTRRSRYGCRECRRLHQRCDEDRPACRHCCLAGKQCSYNRPLSWGGRPFQKSRFGKYLDRGVVQVNSSSDLDREIHFIYGTAREKVPAPSRECVKAIGPPPNESLLPIPKHKPEEQLNIHQEPNWLSFLHPRCHLLLDHFVATVTHSFSLHRILHKDLCSTYLPIALGASHGTPLLAAILSIAVAHRMSLGLNESDMELGRLRQLSLAHLRWQVSGHTNPPDHASAAMALLLCLGEIISGRTEPDARLLHLQEAAAIIRQSFYCSNEIQGPIKFPNRTILWRFWKSLELLAFQCGEQSMPGDAYFARNATREDTSEYIDEFLGHSTRIIPILNEIGQLASEQDGFQKANVFHTNQRSQVRCQEIIEDIKAMISSTNPVFHYSMENAFSKRERDDLSLLDKAYHYVALMQIYRRVLHLPARSSHVQHCVKRIVDIISVIDVQRESCPGMALLQVIFIAGCSASTLEDRWGILDFMVKMESYYAMGNIRLARKYLVDLWEGKITRG